MRGLLVIVVLSVAAVVLADKDGFKKIADGCIKELGIKTNDKGHPDPKDAQEKCLAKCIGLKMKAIDDNGKVIEANIPEKMRANAKECDEKVKETDVCKRASALMKCILKGKKD